MKKSEMVLELVSDALGQRNIKLESVVRIKSAIREFNGAISAFTIKIFYKKWKENLETSSEIIQFLYRNYKMMAIAKDKPCYHFGRLVDIIVWGPWSGALKK